MNKIILFFIFQLVYLSYQYDHEGRLLTVMDILKAIETDRAKSYIEKKYFEEDANHHANYMLNKILIFNNESDSSFNESVDFYPYLRYRYAILNRVFTSTLNPSISIMIISTNCKSTQIYRLKSLLQSHLIFCESLNTNNFNPINIFSSFHSLRVKMAILLLPRMFIQIYLELTAAFHSEIFHYINIDYIPDAIRKVQFINPLLKISNLLSINSPSMLNNGLMNMVNRSECTISKEKLFFNNEFDILSCQHQSHRIIRIVTAFYSNVVFPLYNTFPKQSKCEVGLPCKKRLKDGSRKWTWLCCAGKYIDMLSAIMSRIKHPFIIYLVEDGKYGSLINGSWNGLVNDLYQGRADISVAKMSLIIKRSKVIDYIHELTEGTPIGFLLKRPNVDLEILNFSFVPKDTNIMLCFLLLLHVAVFLIVYIFECIPFRQNYGQKYTFKDSWSFVGAILFQRDLGGKATSRWSGRFLAITYAFAMAVMISTYTATLTAENVSFEDSPTFHGLRDKMFKDPKKRVGLYLGGNHERLADRYNHTCKRFGVTDDYEISANLLLEGKLDAIIGAKTDLERILMMKTSYCKELVLQVDESVSEYHSWSCQKNSNICNIFSLNILQLLESRDFENIDKKWNPINSCSGKEPKKYPWQYAGGLVICLAVSIVICAAILGLETFFASSKWGKRSYKVN